MPALAKKLPAPTQKERDAERITQLEGELEVYKQRFTEIDVFLDFVRGQKADLAKKKVDLAAAKDTYDRAKSDVRELTESIVGAKDSLFQILEPGAMQALPLFDRMEPASVDVHGEGSDKWRQEPISVLRLSAATNTLLITSDVVLVGQLQDMILASPANWFEKIEGMSGAVSAAVADRLNDFIFEACKGVRK